MNSHQFRTRTEELQELLKDQDLSRLSRRMLDLFSDFPLDIALRKEVIGLRARYNLWIHNESGSGEEEMKLELLANAQELLRQIEEAGAPQAGTQQPVATDQAASSRHVVVNCQQVSKQFRTAKYTFELPEIDLEVRLGEITGIVGENGNGKTTLLRMIAGDLKLSKGSIDYPYFADAVGDWYQIKQNIAFIPQQLPLWNGFLKENLHFAAAIHGIRGEENEERVDFVLHRLGLSQYEDALWSEISSGYKLRFELAKALVWSPKLLIIDEPLANLDINTQEIFLQDLRYLASASVDPLAIVLSSQHLHEVESIADNIIFIKDGQALYNGRMQDFGLDRSHNVYELGTQSNKELIVKSLSYLPEVSLEDLGRYKVIHAPLHISGNDILSSLIHADVKIDYFRDISTSTLKLFREHAKTD